MTISRSLSTNMQSGEKGNIGNDASTVPGAVGHTSVAVG